MSSQFGTVCDQTQFKNDAHTFSLSSDYQATDKLEINGSVLFTDAKADWKGLYLSTPGYVTDAVVLELYSFEDLSRITTYSDLHYQQTELNLGAKYQFTPALQLLAQAGYQIFDDKNPYVYGDQDGQAYRGSLGLAYRF